MTDDKLRPTQADRDLVFSLFRDAAKTPLEIEALNIIREGKGDDAIAVQEVAAFRIAATDTQVNVQCEVTDGVVTGRTDLPVKRVEHQDDGSLTVTVDYWPMSDTQVSKLVSAAKRMLDAAKTAIHFQHQDTNAMLELATEAKNLRAALDGIVSKSA